MYMLSEFEYLPQDFTFIQGRAFPFVQHSVAGNLDDSIAKTMRLWINKFLYVANTTKNLQDMELHNLQSNKALLLMEL